MRPMEDGERRTTPLGAFELPDMRMELTPEMVMRGIDPREFDRLVRFLGYMGVDYKKHVEHLPDGSELPVVAFDSQYGRASVIPLPGTGLLSMVRDGYDAMPNVGLTADDVIRECECV